MGRLAFLLLATLLVVPAGAQAKPAQYTRIVLTNDSGFWLDVNAYGHGGLHGHWGPVPPDGKVVVELVGSSAPFYTEVQVLFKLHSREQDRHAICLVKKTFPNTTGRPPFEERAHNHMKQCWIDPT